MAASRHSTWGLLSTCAGARSLLGRVTCPSAGVVAPVFGRARRLHSRAAPPPRLASSGALTEHGGRHAAMHVAGTGGLTSSIRYSTVVMCDVSRACACPCGQYMYGPMDPVSERGRSVCTHHPTTHCSTPRTTGARPARPMRAPYRHGSQLLESCHGVRVVGAVDLLCGAPLAVTWRGNESFLTMLSVRLRTGRAPGSSS